jgi:hypothetical protein
MYIYYLSIGFAVFFLFIAFLVTESNARYLLAGYNTMNEKQRSEFDLPGYIAYFRKFHIILAISFLLICSSLHFLFGDSVSGFFVVAYPITAYVFFLVDSQKFKLGIQSKAAARIGVWVLVIIGLSTLVFMLWGIQAVKVEHDDECIIMSGAYGKTIPYSEMKSAELITSIPELKGKVQGYEMGHVLKGNFKLTDKTIVLLLVDKREHQILKIQRSEKPTIYLSSSQIDEDVLFRIIDGKLKR